MSIWKYVSVISLLSKLNKEEISKRARNAASVLDVATKIKAEMLFEVLMRRKNIYNQLNGTINRTILHKDKDTYKKGQLWKLFPKLSDFTKLKSRKQNSERAFFFFFLIYAQRPCNFTPMLPINNREPLLLL